MTRLSTAVVLLATFSLAPPAPAQPKAKGPAVVSPEVAADGTVVFRLFAPKAEAVTATVCIRPGRPDR